MGTCYCNCHASEMHYYYLLYQNHTIIISQVFEICHYLPLRFIYNFLSNYPYLFVPSHPSPPFSHVHLPALSRSSAGAAAWLMTRSCMPQSIARSAPTPGVTDQNNSRIPTCGHLFFLRLALYATNSRLSSNSVKIFL